MRNKIYNILFEELSIEDQRLEFVDSTLKEHAIHLPYKIGNLTITANDIIQSYIWKDEYMDDYDLFQSEMIDPIKRMIKIYNNGAILQRVVFLNDISELDKKNLGKHWIGDPDEFFLNGLSYIYEEEYEDKNAYTIKAKIPKHAVDCEETFYNNTTIIEETEITILDDYIPKIKYLGYEEYDR